MNHKIRVAITIFLALYIPVFMISGCSSDTKKAKQYMQKGDYLIEKAMPEIYVLGARLQWFINDQSANILNNDVSIIRRNLEEVINMTEELTSISQQAKTEYQKISNLKNVGEYAEYTNLQMQIIDLASTGIAKLNGYLNEVVESISSGSFDPAKFIAEQPGIETEYLSLAKEMRSLYEEAKKLRIYKNL